MKYTTINSILFFLIFKSALVSASNISLQSGTQFFADWYNNWDAATASTPEGEKARTWLLDHVTDSELLMAFINPVHNKKDLSDFLNYLNTSQTSSTHELQAIQKLGEMEFLYSVTFLSSSPVRPPLSGTTLISVKLKESENGRLLIEKYEIKKYLLDHGHQPKLLLE